MPEPILKVAPGQQDRVMTELNVVQHLQKMDDISPVVLQVYINRICCGTPTSGEVERARRQLSPTPDMAKRASR